MLEVAKKPEVTELKSPLIENFKDIKPQEGMTPKEAGTFWDDYFNNGDLSSAEISKEKVEPVDGHYVSHKDRLDQTPKGDSDRGLWEGERGESKFIPSEVTDAGRKAKEKLAEKSMDGINYKDAEPDFSECAIATVEINDMTENRDDYEDNNGNKHSGNFSQADVKCAEQWNAIAKDGRTDWTGAYVRDWRRANQYSWHERCDTHTMDLVHFDIHSFFSHSGGCAECRVRDGVNSGGGFDE